MHNIYYGNTFTFTFKNINVNLLVFSNKFLNKNDKLIIDLIIKIQYIICLSNKIIKENQLNINIWLTNEIKTFTSKYYLGIQNINSGLTFHNNKLGQIYIFRKEEVSKVLIHELIPSSHP